MMEFVYAYAYFVLYAFLGWVCEDLYCGIPAKKFINRGFFYGPYCPIYGVGALLVLYPLLFVKDYPIYFGCHYHKYFGIYYELGNGNFI